MSHTSPRGSQDLGFLGGDSMNEPQFSPGDRCGPYDIVRFLRSGGMGDVYVAKHSVTRLIVALKCLRVRYQDNAAMASRMKREAQFLARIRARCSSTASLLCRGA